MIDRWENLAAGSGVVVRDEPSVGAEGTRIMSLRTGCMMCARCAGAAETALSEIPGLTEISLDWEEDRVIVEYETSLLSLNGNGLPADGSAIVAWATRLIQVIEGEARVADHATVCGKGTTRKFLV